MFKKTSLEKTLEKGYRHLNNGEYSKAKDMFLKSFALDPDDISVINNLAQLYMMLGETSKSKGYNEILLEKCNEKLAQEKSENLLIIKSNALVSLDMYDQANEVVDEILKINPKNLVALFLKSHYLEKNDLHLEALKHIESILRENPHNIAALLSKGRNLVELDRFGEAEMCYNHVFEIEPKNKAAINLKSNLYKKKNNVAITPHDFMLKAVESFEMKNFRESEDYFKKALMMDSNFDEIWFAQGELFIRIGKIGSAIDSFKNAFDLNPKSGGIERKNEFFKLLNKMKKINVLLGYENR